MKSHLKQKARRLAGGQSMIEWLADQSRHRAACVRARHQRWAADVAAMAFRCVIKSLLGQMIARRQASVLQLTAASAKGIWSTGSAGRV
jgi:hypothetical protein